MKLRILLLLAVWPLQAVGQAAASSITPRAIVTGLLSSQAVAINPVSRKVYAVDTPHGAVVVIDAKMHTSRRVLVGAGPVSIAINSRTNRVYVANNGGGSVSVLDGSTDTVLATLDVGRTPYVLAVDDATNRVYISNTFSSVIRVLDGATNAIHIFHASSADKIVIDQERHKIYLMGYEGGLLTIVDDRTEAVRHVSAGDLHLWGMALDPGSGALYIARIERGDIMVIARDGEVGSPIMTGRMPCALALDSSRSLLYVANYQDDSVTVVDILKRGVIATVPVGPHPQAILSDPQANLIYVANMHGDSISVIDGSQKRVIATLKAGHHPFALALDAQGGTVFAADFDAMPVTAIDVRHLRKSAVRRMASQ